MPTELPEALKRRRNLGLALYVVGQLFGGGLVKMEMSADAVSWPRAGRAPASSRLSALTATVARRRNRLLADVVLADMSVPSLRMALCGVDVSAH